MRKPEIAAGGPVSAPASVSKWLAFILGVALVAGFAFGAIPVLERLPATKPFVEKMKETGIEAGAIYYTDVEKVREAEIYIRHVQKYNPHEI